jgi:hypothetical protein
MTRYLLHSRLGGLQGRSGRVRTILSPPKFDSRTVQSVARRYTDYATPALSPGTYQLKTPEDLCEQNVLKYRDKVPCNAGEQEKTSLNWGKELT